MLCEKCNKNEAVIHYTEVREGRPRTRNLCADCARERGITEPLEQSIISLGAAIGSVIGSFLEAELEAGKAACPRCGLTLAEFRESGLLGCDSCYQAFAAVLQPMLAKLHGADQHFGKTPGGVPRPDGADNRRQAIAQRLREAVAGEEFELAAKLRDQLKQLEAGVPQ